MNVNWIKHYANPRGYSLNHIRNELYGIKSGSDGIYMFGGTGDEGNYSATISPSCLLTYGMDGFFQLIKMVIF